MAQDKAAAAKSVTVQFKREKVTKNTVKFQEVPAEGKPPVIGSLYVQSWFVGAAETVELTLAVK